MKSKMKMKCLICSKEDIINMGSHLRAAHQMSNDDYVVWLGKNRDKVGYNEPVSEDDDFEELDGTVEELAESSSIVTQKDLEKHILPDVVNHVDRPLKDFLEEHGVTEKEIVEIISAYKKDSIVSVNQSMNNAMKNAEIKALELSDGDSVETIDLYVAEILTKKYGFECNTVTSNPKTWVLNKIK